MILSFDSVLVISVKISLKCIKNATFWISEIIRVMSEGFWGQFERLLLAKE